MKSLVAILIVFGFFGILIWSSPHNPMEDYQGIKPSALYAPWPYDLTGRSAPTNVDGTWHWTIFDRPDIQGMLITYPHELNVQATYLYVPEIYARAADQYLHETKRDACTVGGPELINPYFVEVKYSCSQRSF